MKHMVRVIVWCLIILSVTTVLAQSGDCPTIVQSALTATDQYCGATGRNQACYGNLNLQATPQQGFAFTFEKPGDLVDVGNVQSLDLSPLDPEGETWGVALMKIQANLPDTLPGQNVTFLLFGNVEIQNAVGAAGTTEAAGGATLTATVSGTAPMMESMTDASKMPTMLNNGTAVTVDGRDPSGQMLHIQLEDGSAGWTPAQMLKVDGDVSMLPQMNLIDIGGAAPTAVPAAVEQSPMQAFYFKTGSNDAPCAEAPDSGILIQTPEGAGKINLTMNGVDVQLGSTAYVQAPEAGEEPALTVNVVEGEGEVSSEGETKVVPAGTRVQVPLKEEDGHFVPDGTPGDVEPYDDANLGALPIDHLERDITLAPPLTTDAITALSSEQINIVGGAWALTYGEAAAGASCPAQMSMILSSMNAQMSEEPLNFPEGQLDLEAAFAASNAPLPAGYTITNPEPNIFVMQFSQEGSSVNYEFHVISSTHIDLVMNVTIDGGCVITFPATMEPAG